MHKIRSLISIAAVGRYYSKISNWSWHQILLHRVGMSVVESIHLTLEIFWLTIVNSFTHESRLDKTLLLQSDRDRIA